MRFNIGCGKSKWKDFVNIDCNVSVNPDIALDIKRQPLPCFDGEADEIWMFHTLEHIEKALWPKIFIEFNRALKIDGILNLAYPEFSICANNWIRNYRANRQFWEATLYGRQLYKGDYHVAIVDSEELTIMLREHGFGNIRTAPEPEPNEFYSVLSCKKAINTVNRETLMNREILAV